MGLKDLFNGGSGEEMSELKDALVEELKDLYSAEKQLVKALPKMEKGASNPKLKKAIRDHLEETKIQIERLEQMGEELGERLSGKTCKGMEGLIKEGEEALSESSENKAIIDALIIGAAQRVEHYEIAAYGTSRAMAEQLGASKIVKLLDMTIKEEGAADKKLTQISEGEVLPAAFKGSESKKNPRVASKSMKNSQRSNAMKKMRGGRGSSSASSQPNM